ncbi:Group XV phospholipase A2, partial [Araneus ventricosus]
TRLLEIVVSILLEPLNYRAFLSHVLCFDVPCLKYAISSAVEPQIFVVAGGFVGWLERSGEMGKCSYLKRSDSTDEDLSTVPIGCCREQCVLSDSDPQQIPNDTTQVDR